MLNKASARIVEVVAEREGAQELLVEVEGARCRAVNYTALCGSLQPEDEVLLNTTAVDLGLGTGGVHFVIAAAGRRESTEHGAQSAGPGEGHIVKLRYTPLQHSVLCLEEEGSPHREAMEGFESLDGMPVVCCELHSQLAAVCAAAKACSEKPIAIGYIMTDTAALPAGFSRLVPALKERGLLDFVVTCGQAFGGDYEAVNLYSALAAAKAALSADVAVIAQGPGNVGTATEFGHGGVEVGVAANAVISLGGEAIIALRISFADPRARHLGVSHHSITALSKVALGPVTVPTPSFEGEQAGRIEAQLSDATLAAKGHRLERVEIEPVRAAIETNSDIMRTMGRTYAEDREFFLAAGCAGLLAVRRLGF